MALVFCFFPLAGFLADVEYGRYKMVVGSLCLLLITIILLAVTAGCITGVTFVDSYVEFVILLCGFSLLGFVFLVPFYASLVGFTANVVQFGMDQLHDCPEEDRTLFIHWYVWVYFVTIVIGQLAWNLAVQLPYNDASYIEWYNITGFVLLSLIPLLVMLLLIISLCLTKRRRNWFLIEPGTVNPYKLVYRVTKFACQHKTPVHRCDCEDEIPTGLDLGKEKYGGPFSTEQVEDAKVFYGILKVLFSFGAVFFLDFAASSVLPFYALHTSWYIGDYNLTLQSGAIPEHILLNCGLLSPLY